MTDVPPNTLTLRRSTYYRLKHVWQRVRIGASVARGAPVWSGARILGYHSISSASHELALAPHRFRTHMEALVNGGLHPIRLTGEVPELVPGRRYIAVTFDDGYRDLLDVAPLLERLEIPATVFVCSAVLDGDASFTWYGVQPPLLRWDDLGALAARGWITIGAHTRSHRILPLLDDETARDEIYGSKADIEERLQVPVDAFCYPAGLLSDRDVDLVARAGFTYACTCEPGTNLAGGDLLRLRRTMIDRRDTMLDFRAKLAGRLDTPSRLRRRLRQRLVRTPDSSEPHAPLEE